MKKKRRGGSPLKPWQSLTLLLLIALMVLAPRIIKGVDWLGRTLVHENLDIQIIDKKQTTIAREVCMQKLRPGVCERTKVISDTYYVLVTEDEDLFATAEQYKQVAVGKIYTLEVNGWQTPFTHRHVIRVYE